MIYWRGVFHAQTILYRGAQAKHQFLKHMKKSVLLRYLELCHKYINLSEALFFDASDKSAGLDRIFRRRILRKHEKRKNQDQHNSRKLRVTSHFFNCNPTIIRYKQENSIMPMQERSKLPRSTLVATFLALASSGLAEAQQRYDIVSTSTSDVPNTQSVEYSCTFRNSWSAENHPRLYPDDAHWSPPVLVSHDMSYKMWSPGEFSTAGVELVAETGSPRTLLDEFAAANSSVGSYVVGSLTFNSNQQEQTFDNLVVDSNHPMLSTITMIAPSPDWFSGFYDFELFDATTSTWFSNFVLDTYPFDAGTETGGNYSLANTAEDPTLPIDEFTASNPLSTGVFLTLDESTVLPVAQWECTLIADEPGTPVSSPVPSPAPNTCKAIFQPCTASAECCSGMCDTRALLLGRSTTSTCRSAPKALREKLSGEQRGGAAGRTGASVAVGQTGFGGGRRGLIRGG